MLIINKLKFLALQLLIRKVKQANAHNTSKSLTRRRRRRKKYLPACKLWRTIVDFEIYFLSASRHSYWPCM